MIHLLAILGIVIWFALTGLLWYAKPSDVLWFAGSMLLGIAGFSGFFCYVGKT